MDKQSMNANEFPGEDQPLGFAPAQTDAGSLPQRFETESGGAEPVEAAEDFDASEYVRKLIARMGTGGSLPPQPISKSPVNTNAPSTASSTTSPAQSSKPRAALPLAEARSSLSEIQPEEVSLDAASPSAKDGNTRPVDLAKLREAANLSTSTVLHVFDCKSLIRRAYSELLVAGIAMATSLVLLTMCDRIRSLAFVACVAMLGVAGIATGRYTVTTRMLGDKLRMPR